MLAYLSTDDPVMTIGLVLVFVGITIFVPLTLRGGRIASYAVSAAFVCVVGGSALGCYGIFERGANTNDPEHMRDVVRVLAMIAFAVAFKIATNTYYGYRAGRRGGISETISWLTRGHF